MRISTLPATKALLSPGGQMQPTQGEKISKLKGDSGQIHRGKNKSVQIAHQVGGADGEAGCSKSSDRETSAVHRLLLPCQTYQGRETPGMLFLKLL